MSDWIRRREHLAAIQRRDQTIRSLQAQLADLAGIAALIPMAYASELVTLAEAAYNGSSSSALRGKAESRPPAHNAAAYAALKRELASLERRAQRDGEGKPLGPLAIAVDRMRPPS